MHDEHRDDPALAFSLSRLASQPTMPTPCGVFRDVTRPTYELEVQQQLVRGFGATGPRRPRRRSSAPAPPGTSTEPPVAEGHAASVVEGAEHHAAARLRREEGRLLRHAHARAAAAARIVSTATGRSSTAASAAPVSHLRGHDVRVVAVREGRARDRGEDTRVEPRRVDLARVGRELGDRRVEAGWGTSSARPLRSTRPSAPSACIADSSAATPFGCVGAQVVHARTCRRARRGGRGRVDRRSAVDRANAQLVVGQLDHEHHDEPGTGRRRRPRSSR